MAATDILPVVTGIGTTPASKKITVANLNAALDHTALANIGSNSHSSIDTALSRLANTSGTNTGDQTISTIGAVGVPATTTSGHITQFGNSAGAILDNGVAITTSVGSPGSDTNLPTEKATRTLVGGYVTTGTTVNSKALSGNITLAASDVGAVSTATTVNGHALSSNVTVTTGDIGASHVPASTTTSGHVTAFINTTGDIYDTGKAISDLANTSGSNTGDQTVPSTEAGAANNFLTSYSATTGLHGKAQPTWANIDKSTSSIADITTRSHTALTDIGTNTHTTIDTHLDSTANPHSTTANQVLPGQVNWNNYVLTTSGGNTAWMPVRELTISGSAIGANQMARGTKVILTASGAMNFGDVGYVDIAGKVNKANASAIATAYASVMCADTYIAAGALGNFLMHGVARNDAWTWTNGPVYLAASAGSMTQTAPSATDNVTQYMGVATSSTHMLFMPSLVPVEHT
jgi:hypothetical protein